MWLHGVHIPEYTQGTWTNHAARRKRKLLLNRTEIAKIERKITEKGFTLVPLSLYFKDGRAKVEIALARGKKAYDKRHTLAERRPTARRSRRCGAGSRAHQRLTSRADDASGSGSGCPGCSTCTPTSCRRG